MKAWSATLGDNKIYRFALNCKAQLVTCGDEFITTADSIANKASATRAGYSSWKAAMITATYGITSLETLVKKSEKKDAATHGSYVFTPAFGSAAIFEGTVEHKTKDATKKQLADNMDIH